MEETQTEIIITNEEKFNDNDIINLFNDLSITTPHNNDNIDIDITKDENIKDKYSKSKIKKWIKLIPLNKSYDFMLYKRKDYFIHVANIILDVELNKDNNKKRDTLIQFVPVIDKKIFEDKT